MSDEDVEDIIAKIEGEEEEDAEGGEDIDIDMDTEEGGEDIDIDMDTEEGGEELAEAEDKEEESGKQTIDISKGQMEDLHKEGVCECDGKCLVYPSAEGVDAEDILKKAEKTGKECIFISKEQMDMLHEKGKCSCGGVTLKSDTKKQKEVIEDQKSVIKVDVPKTEAPVEDEVEDDRFLIFNNFFLFFFNNLTLNLI